MNTCKHTDGWMLLTQILVNSKIGNDDFIGTFVCNHLGCKMMKQMHFDITNVREINALAIQNKRVTNILTARLHDELLGSESKWRTKKC